MDGYNSYCTISQFNNLAATKAASINWKPESIIAELQRASSLCDTYIMSQLDLPLTYYDMWLAGLVADIAAFYLYTEYGFNGNAGNDRTIIERYKSAINWLTAYSKQEVKATWKGQDGTALEAAGPSVYSNAPVGFGTNCGGNGVF